MFKARNIIIKFATILTAMCKARTSFNILARWAMAGPRAL